MKRKKETNRKGITIKDIWRINQSEKVLKSKCLYSRTIRPIFIPLTKPFLNFNPNFLTLIMIFIGLSSLIFFSIGGYKNIIIGALIFQLYYFSDIIDGNVARTMKKTSLRGQFFDYVPNIIYLPLIFVTLGFGLFMTTNSLIFIYLGILAGFSFLALEPIRLFKYLMFEEKNIKERVQGGVKNSRGLIKKMDFLFGFPNIMIFLLLLALLNLAKYWLIFFAMIFPLILVARIAYEFYNIKKIDKKW